jgi:hypothetical protein
MTSFNCLYVANRFTVRFRLGGARSSHLRMVPLVVANQPTWVGSVPLIPFTLLTSAATDENKDDLVNRVKLEEVRIVVCLPLPAGTIERILLIDDNQWWYSGAQFDLPELRLPELTMLDNET